LDISANSITNSNLITAKDKLEINSAALENSAEISSLDEIKINAATIENSGDILAQNSLEITAQNLTNDEYATIASLTAGAALNVSDELTNDGLISAQTLTILNADISNSGEISSAGDLEISAQLILNNGRILAQENAAINAATLTNNNQILAQNNLTIETSGNIANSERIYAKNNLSLTAAVIGNLNEILADNQITINATTLNNNTANSLILAQDDLNIFATQLNNQNTRESNGSAVNSGLISREGDINLRANGLNNSSGLIMGNQNFLSALNAQSVSLNNNSGRFVSNQQISLNLGDTDYAISGQITAQNIDITARNIVNTGNVTALDFIKLNATGNASTGDGNFTNGIVSTNNINVVLSAGTYVDIIANGVLTNYGTISAEGDLSLVSNERNVENFGHIKSGNNLSITSDNATIFNFPQAIISAENNLNLTAAIASNYAEISAGNDLEINTSDDYFNLEGAVNYSGRDSTFNIGDTLVNSFSTIYAERNLNLQKNNSSDAAQNKMNALHNVSGNIETYAGDISIKAVTLGNGRAVDPVTGLISANANCSFSGSSLICGYDHSGNYQRANNHYLYNWNWVTMWGWGDKGGTTHYSTQQGIVQSNSLSSQINSGGALNINSNIINNDLSEISSVGNSNLTFSDRITNRTLTYGKNVTYADISDDPYTEWCGAGRCYWGEYYFNNFQSYSSFIKSGGSLTITQNGNNISGGIINGGNIAQNVGVQTANQRSANITVNNVELYTLAETGEVDVDLSRITSAINNFSAQTSSASFTQNQQISSINNNSQNNFQVQILAAGSVNNNISGVTIGAPSQTVDSSNFFKTNISGQGNNLSFAVKSIENQPIVTLNSSSFTSSQTSTISNLNNNSTQSSTINHSTNLPSANSHNIAINSQTSAGQNGFTISGVTINSAINNQLPGVSQVSGGLNNVPTIAPRQINPSEAPAVSNNIDNLSNLTSSNASASEVNVDNQSAQIGDNSLDRIAQGGGSGSVNEAQINNSTTSNTANNQALQNQTITNRSGANIGEISTTPIAISEIDNSQTGLSFANVDLENSIKYSGNFKINLNPTNNSPIVEKRVDFIDLNRYYGSSYYFTQLGFSGDAFMSELNQYNRGFLNGAQSDIQAQSNSSCLENPARCNAIFDPNNSYKYGAKLSDGLARSSNVNLGAMGEGNEESLGNLNTATNVSQIYLLGDSFVETSLIRDTLSKIRNDAVYLSDNETDINSEIKSLLDNSIAELNRLNIDIKDVALSGLTKEQTKLLQNDIITFEVVEVNGLQALAPKIYLSQTSIDKLLGTNIAGNNNNANSLSLATNSSIYAKENLTINAPDAVLSNSGSIKAGNNINLNVASLTNKTISFTNSNIGGISNVDNLTAATISSGNNLTITANTGDIKNIAANIFARNNLSITATNGSILNSALVSTNDVNLLASNSDAYISNGMQSLTIANNASNLSGNINSSLLGISSIKGGSIAINAKNDFTNLASEITTTTPSPLEGEGGVRGNLSITAGDDINIQALELRNRTETTWGSRKRGGSSITDTTTNIGSNIEAAGNITLQTTGNGTDTEGTRALELFTAKQTKISAIEDKISALNPNSKTFSSRVKAFNNQIADINSEYQNNI